MAADDDDRKPEPDPWADIVADGIDGDEESSFQFDAEPAAVSPPDDIPAVADESTAAAASDELVDAWLAEDDDASSTPGEHAPLAVFAPEDAASGSSSIDIGTGLSGIDGDSSRGAVEESSEIAAEAWGEEPVDAAGDAGEALTIDGGDAVEAESVEFPGVSIAAAAATAAPLTTGTRRPAAAKKPAGGIGQMIGVALGGFAAIPITLGILIWGLQKDPFGVTKSVPSSVSFLLPAKFRPGFKKAKPVSGTLADAPTLDDLPAAALPSLDEPSPDVAAAPAGEPETGTTSEEPAAPSEPSLGDVAVTEPPVAEEAAAEPAATDAVISEPVVPAADPGTEVTDTTAAVAVEGGLADAPAASLDDFLEPATERAADPPAAAAAAAAEPPPLDLSGLETAVADATALGEAVAAADAADEAPYKRLLVQWYRSLAGVAEQLTALERTAADSGRPLAATPEQVATLHAGIADRDVHATALARVAADWLDYARRGGDGVVVPVVFESARRAGPYWTAKATLERSDGSVRSLAIVSRSEPVATAGDRLIVTGVVLEDGVIWAADCRPMAASAQPVAPF